MGALCGGGGMVVAQATSVAIFAAKTHWQVGQPAAALYSMARLAPAVWVESLVNDLSSLFPNELMPLNRSCRQCRVGARCFSLDDPRTACSNTSNLWHQNQNFLCNLQMRIAWPANITAEVCFVSEVAARSEMQQAVADRQQKDAET